MRGYEGRERDEGFINFLPQFFHYRVAGAGSTEKVTDCQR